MPSGEEVLRTAPPSLIGVPTMVFLRPLAEALQTVDQGEEGVSGVVQEDSLEAGVLEVAVAQ